MEFRRIPFQFSTTDPLKRQEELQRRFGLPVSVNKGNMYVDSASNFGGMGSRSENSSSSNSPRLQHRVPIFVEGQSEPSKPSVDVQNVDSGPKPRVRVVPIELEGEDNRHRWLSGSSEPFKEKYNGVNVPVKTAKHPFQDTPPQSPKAPRVCNIPIKIEGSNRVIKPKSPAKIQKVKSSPNTEAKLNGCSASKVAKVNEKKVHPNVNEKRESPDQVTLKKIETIEEKLKVFHAAVEEFSGTNKEKQYRYLDEMLTRCMLELDEIDTMGLDTLRLARKAAIKKVQASIDLLESKTIKDCKHDQDLKELMEVDVAKLSAADTKESEKSVFIKTHTDSQIEVENNSHKMTDVLPEKVENISIMKIEDVSSKGEPVSNDDLTKDLIVTDEMSSGVTESVQITEVEAGVGANACESEPLVEEPLFDSKDENVDMDQDSCKIDYDPKLSKTSTVQVCELKDNSSTSLNQELKNSEQLNLEMEFAETSEAPVISGTVSDHNTLGTVCADSYKDSISICNPDIPANSK